MITVNITKARDIAHATRRVARAAEFAPIDDAIAKRIPGKTFEDLESERDIVREKYYRMQIDIDKADSVEQLSQIVAVFR